jgi:glycyl-tRNA synthetase
MDILNRIDDSPASIGKRYARNDELGSPLAITVDFQSLEDNIFTLRDRDTMKQVRADEDALCEAIEDVIDGAKAWSQVYEELSKFASQESH